MHFNIKVFFGVTLSDLDKEANNFPFLKLIFFSFSIVVENSKDISKVDRCLARYSPRAKANNAIP